MKAHEAIIAWSGWDDFAPYAGTVCVGRLTATGKVEWPGPGANTFGVSTQTLMTMRSGTGIEGLFQDFHYLVVEERLNPEILHKAFLAIDEYAELFGSSKKN